MRRAVTASAIVAALILAAGPTVGFSPAVKPSNVAIDAKNKAITFTAVVTAKKWQEHKPPVARYAKGYDPERWHLIISGTQANPSVGRVPVFVSWASKEEIDQALSSLGAKGEKFDHKTYYDHADKSSKFPDMKPQGSRLSIFVTWTEKGEEKTIDVNECIENSTGNKLELVYIGNQHPSHCVVCMYGCVGALAPNQSLTVRDYYDRGAEWRLKPGVLPPDGTRVLLTMKLES